MQKFPDAAPRTSDTTGNKPAEEEPGGEIDEIAVPGGAVRLRPAQPSDAQFLFDLFRAHHIGMLRLGGLPDPMIENLLAMQYRSRTQSYRDRFPGARWSVIESAGVAIGELIAHDEADAIYVVDIALLPERQGRGIGSALIRSVIAAGAARGGVRAMVLLNNDISLKMFRRLGFVEGGHDGGARVELRWRPPTPAST
jgi:ribosomal protein S18 acetylase RimI-like enzyme